VRAQSILLYADAHNSVAALSWKVDADMIIVADPLDSHLDVRACAGALRSPRR
jgi:hypothetical protein